MKTHELDELMLSLDPSLFKEWTFLVEEESPAAEEAKKNNLHYIGFGRWANQENRFVAKTQNDRLVWVNRAATQPTDTTSAQQEPEVPDTPPSNPMVNPDIDNNSYGNESDWRQKEQDWTPHSIDTETKNLAELYTLAPKILHKKVGGQKGSNPGGVFRGIDNHTRYVKVYENPQQAENEYLTNNLYNLLGEGFTAPETMTFPIGDSDTAVSTNWVYHSLTYGEIKHHKDIRQKHGPDYMKIFAQNILKGYALDVLLANWDVVGLEFDNIKFREADVDTPSFVDIPLRVDNGAGLLFRAQGGKKDVNRLSDLSEWEGFANPMVNPQYSQIIKDAGYANSKEFFHAYAPNLIKQVKKIQDHINGFGGIEALVKRAALRQEYSSIDLKQIENILSARLRRLHEETTKLVKKEVVSHPKPPKSTDPFKQEIGLARFGRELAKSLISSEFLSPSQDPKKKNKHIKQIREARKEMASRIMFAVYAYATQLKTNSDWSYHPRYAIKGDDITLGDVMIRGYGEALRKIMNDSDLKLDINQFAYNIFKERAVTFQNQETYTHSKLVNQSDYDDNWNAVYSNESQEHLWDRGINTAKLQNMQWRLSLKPVEIANLAKIQNSWQSSGHHSIQKSIRKKRNKFINKVVGGLNNPATFEWNDYISRGMTFYNPRELEKFLTHFKENARGLVLPPSGFSLIASVANRFGKPDMVDSCASVIIRIHPDEKNGRQQLNGVNLAHSYSANRDIYQENRKKWDELRAKYRHTEMKWGQDHPAPPPPPSGAPIEIIRKYDEQVVAWRKERHAYLNPLSNKVEKYYSTYVSPFSNMDNFNDELEVMRPGNLVSKIVKSEKHVFIDAKGTARPVYVVHLTNGELTDDPSLMKEDIIFENKDDELLDKYLNTSLNQEPKVSDHLSLQTESVILTEAEEHTAADEAKSKGLHYIGFGRWANNLNQFVAKTVNNHLVMVHPNQQEEPKATLHNPTYTASKMMSHAPNNPNISQAPEPKPAPTNYDAETPSQPTQDKLDKTVQFVKEKTERTYGKEATDYMGYPVPDSLAYNGGNGGLWLDRTNRLNAIQIYGSDSNDHVLAIANSFAANNMYFMSKNSIVNTQYLFPIKNGRIGSATVPLLENSYEPLPDYMNSLTAMTEKKESLKAFAQNIPLMILFGVAEPLLVPSRHVFFHKKNLSEAPSISFGETSFDAYIQNGYDETTIEEEHERRCGYLWNNLFDSYAHRYLTAKGESIRWNSLTNMEMVPSMIGQAYDGNLRQFKIDLIDSISHILTSLKVSELADIPDKTFGLNSKLESMVKGGAKFFEKKLKELEKDVKGAPTKPPKTLNSKTQTKSLLKLGNILKERIHVSLKGRPRHKEFGKFIGLATWRLANKIIEEKKLHSIVNGLDDPTLERDCIDLMATRISGIETRKIMGEVIEYAKQLVPYLEKGLKINPMDFMSDLGKFTQTSFVPGEKTIVHNYYSNQKEYDKMADWIRGVGIMPSKTKNEFARESRKEAMNQWSNWASKLNHKDFNKLVAIKVNWQQSSQYRTPKKSRRARNAFLNRTIGNPENPAKFKSKHLIERGMAIADKDIKLFFSHFGGDTVVLPPSGFTEDWSVARDSFAGGGSDTSVSVLLRLEPTADGTIHGLNLHNATDAMQNHPLHKKYHEKMNHLEKLSSDLYSQMEAAEYKEDWKEAEKLAEKSRDIQGQIEDLRDKYPLFRYDADEYDYELEVMRPGNALNKIKNVEKHLFYSSSGMVSCSYVITLEDAGIAKDKKLWKESKELQADSDVLAKYLNTSVEEISQQNEYLEHTQL